MNWVTDPDRIKVQWRLIWMNAFAVFMNLAVGVVVWKWMSLANLFSAGFSAWVAYGLWKKLPEIKREQQQRVIDYLRKDYAPQRIQ